MRQCGLPTGGKQNASGWARSRWPGGLVMVVAAPLQAASFLTVLPFPVPKALGAMGWAVACFPIVGAALGLLLAGVDRILSMWLPAAVVAALLLSALLLVTGALHLDGLMDSFDGLFGGRDPAGRLLIMRDSRVGSYGVAAALSILLVEYGCLVSLPLAGRAQALVLSLVLSRWAMATSLWAFPAAASNGLAAGLKLEVRGEHVAVASLVTAIVIALSGPIGLAMGLIACLLVVLVGRLVVRKLGGITGDSCGGLGQLVEAAMLVLSVVTTVSS